MTPASSAAAALAQPAVVDVSADPERLLTLPEVADLLRLSVDTLRYWRHRGEGPPGFRLGRRVLFRRAEVLAWLDEQIAAGRAAP